MRIKGGIIPVLLCGVLVSVIIFFSSHSSEKYGYLRVSFLDVGQGDAALVRTAEGQNILIDGGPDKSVLRQMAGRLPWWERTIDLAVLTHPHSDHLDGLIDILRRYRVEAVACSGTRSEEPDFQLWESLLREEGSEIYLIEQATRISFGQDSKLEFIYPLSPYDISSQRNLNETSLVARLRFGKSSILFMGDAEIGTEAQLLSSGQDLSADILKLGHHGSDTSSGEAFLRSVGMDQAVVSVGAENDFGHPSPLILGRLQRAGARVYRTDTSGSLDFYCRKEGGCFLK